MTSDKRPALWLRAERKSGERRSALVPDSVAALVGAGVEVTVERSAVRAFADDDYARAGATLVAADAWRAAPRAALIVGLKELDATLGPFMHRHLHFAHAFKRQRGWRELLLAFESGGGRLYDLEYLVDEAGRRIAAFGYWAGYVGAALGVLARAAAHGGTTPLTGPLVPWPDREALLADVRHAARSVPSESALVIGARGRSGRGATDLLRAAGYRTLEWDIEETRAGGPFDALLEHPLVVNCVYVSKPLAPFATEATLAGPTRRTAVLVDVSCDPFGPANVLPVYSEPTTLERPVRRLFDSVGDRPALDLVAIDHLPSLLPRESSEDFAAQLLPSLLALDGEAALERGPFGRAARTFERCLADAKAAALSSDGALDE